MAGSEAVLDSETYDELKERVEAGDTEDLSVEEEYTVRRRMVEETYDDRRDAIDAYRKEKRLRGFDRKAKKRSYKNTAGKVGAGIGTPAAGVATFKTLGVAGSLLAWPMVLGGAAAGGAAAGLAAYYGTGKLADRAIDGRNRYVASKAKTKERMADVRESLDKTVLDMKERKDTGLAYVRSVLDRGEDEPA